MFKRIGIFLLAGVIGAFCLELGEQIGIPGRSRNSLRVPRPGLAVR